jgi:hypothetical protein
MQGRFLQRNLAVSVEGNGSELSGTLGRDRVGLEAI